MKGRVYWDSSQRQLDSAKLIWETWYYNNIRGKNKGWCTCRCNASETLAFRSFAVGNKCSLLNVSMIETAAHQTTSYS